MTRPIETDDFALSLEKILNRVGDGAEVRMPQIVGKGVKKSAALWRKKAGNLWPSGDAGRKYKKHGKVFTTGAYSKSIRSHMIRKDGSTPSGEAGAPKMPGLAHLLEEGHAKVGGGRTRAFPHVSEAAEEAFEYTLGLAGVEMEKMLDDV